jgi:glucokinase
MIIGVDIGGTKTLLAVFAENGKLLKEVRFETSRDYDTFLADLKRRADSLETTKAKVACVAVPGAVDREEGKILGLGNLPWKDVYIQHDAANALGVASVCIENDANLAGLAEARALAKPSPLVVYITLSTGIGSGIIVNNKLIPELNGSEAGQMLVRDSDGTAHRWETFASGQALVALTGKRADELTDKKLWNQYVVKVCLGLQPTISTLRPQKVILGGGVGAQLEKFHGMLVDQLEALNHSRTYTNPEILGAHYGENSVIYGCYEYAKDHLA